MYRQHFVNLATVATLVSIAFSSSNAWPANPAPVLFVRGNVDGSGKLSVADAVRLAEFIDGGPPPLCLAAADANDDERVDKLDVLAIHNAILWGIALPPPGPRPGTDPTPGIGCLGALEEEEVDPRPRLGDCHPYRVDQSVVVNVLDFGANGDDFEDGMSEADDDTPAFIEALAAIPSAQGGVLLVPAGAYVIRDTLVVAKAAPIHVLGVGSTGLPRGSALFWLGANDRPLLRLVGLSDSRVEGLGIAAPHGYQLMVGIQSETTGKRATTRNTFKELYLTSASEQLFDGFRFVAGDDVGGKGPDIGNDNHCFERVSLKNYTNTAFRFLHPSSSGHLFVQVTFACSGLGGGRSGVSTEPAPGRQGGGGFTWIGGNGSACDVASFELAEPRAPVTIEGIDGEVSRQAIVSVGPALRSKGVAEVTYRSGRFDRLPGDDVLPVVEYHFAGRLTIEDSEWTVPAAARVRVHPAAPCALRIRNNSFYLYAAALDFDVADINGNVTLESYGNQFSYDGDEGRISDHAPATTPPAAMPSPPAPRPALVSGRLPRPSNVELLMTTSVYDVTDPLYRAVPNDTGDDTLAFREAIAAAEGHHQGGIVYVPAGTYRISDTLLVGSHQSLKFRGDGSQGTILEWHGLGDRPLLLLNDQTDSVFAYFSIRTGASCHLHAGIVSKTDPLLVHRIATNLAFYDVTIDGAGRLDFGWRISPEVISKTSWFDYNNEHHYFVECRASGYLQAGYSIEHTQSKLHLFLNSSFDGEDLGLYGVATTFVGASGSFKWIGGGGGRNLSADFNLGGPDDFILIRDGKFHGSRRFLQSGFTGAAWNMNLYRNHWTTASLDPLLPRIIDHNKVGPVVLEGNIFQLDGTPPPGAVIFHSSYAPSAATAIANEFRWAGSDAMARVITYGPFDGGTGTHERTLRGNISYDAAFNTVVRATEP